MVEDKGKGSEGTASNQGNRGFRCRTSEGLSGLAYCIKLLVMSKILVSLFAGKKSDCDIGLIRGRESGEAERAKFYPP